MNNPKKAKFIIALATLLLVALFTVSIALVINIAKTKNQIEKQNKQLYQLEQELDYYKNKLENSTEPNK